MFRTIGIPLLMLLLCLPVSATSVAIRGIVIDADSREPIPGATVMIEGTTKGTSSDLLGQFVIEGLSRDKFMLSVSSIGYSNKTEELRLHQNNIDKLEIKLNRSPLEIDGIVVTGTRTPRFITDAPVRTQVVTKTSIEKKSAANIFEALDGESGVRVEQQCQACNFSILRMQGLGADHTQILLDGQPVYSGLASVYGLQQLSTADVDRIEIVKGAGSALYGSNAVAGAINIISSIPRETGGEITLEMGEYGTRKYDLSVGTRKDNVGIFIFAQNNEQDEIDQTGDINAPGGVDNPDGWIDRVKSSAKNLGFNIFVDNLFASDQLVFRGRLLNETRNGGWLDNNLFLNRFAPGTEGIITDRYSGGLSYKIWLPGGAELNADLSLTRHKRDATNDTFLGDYEDAFGESPDINLLRPYLANEQLIIGNINYIHTPISGHTFLVGFQVSHNKLDESGMYVDSDQLEAYLSTSAKEALELGAYIQDEFRLTKKLELVAGLRLDYHNSEDKFHGSGDVLPSGLEPLEYDETALNPRFSIKYAAAEGLNIRGSVGTGFRVPYGFSEDLHLCSGSPRVYKGGNLKSEKSVSYSLNADYFSPKLTAGINLYRTELSDAIAFAEADEVVAGMGYTYEWKNINDAYVTGAEFDLSYSLIDDLACRLSFEIFRGKYDSPRQDWAGTEYETISRNISRYPATSGGIGLEYTPSLWSFILDVDYTGKMYIDLTEPADEADIKIHETENYFIVNTRISRSFFGKYSLYAGAKNLTDYTQEEKHIDDAAFMYAPVYGRIVYGGIQIAF
nr:TonB-dependent receptor [candidate division Zixibacteria bacterium]